MSTIDVVIGANYGDEGKGITTARIAKSYNDPARILIVLNNGGSQRGHSVSYNGKEHVFKHFGSATPLGIASYFGPKYILNPMQYVKESEEIFDLYGFAPISKRSVKCKWTTPWDMMANQLRQKEFWTGSCGMGIWETELRCSKGYIGFDEFMLKSHDEKVEYLKAIRDIYYKQINPVVITSEYKDAWFSDGTIEHFIEDCEKMYYTCEPLSYSLLSSVEHVIVENGQGLLLNDDGKDDSEKTPSKTGIETILDVNLKTLPKIHFVTRPYLTRHGSLNWENNKKAHSFVDKSTEINQYNEWQRDFCYANLSIEDLKNRCDNEMERFGLNDYILEVTHCDELDAEEDFKRYFINNKINYYGSKEL